MMKIFWLAPLTVAVALGWLYFTTNPSLPNLDISINFASAEDRGY
jgi:hypothetical protein